MRYRPVSQARCWFGLQLALVLLGLPVSIARGVPPIELEFVLAATSPLYLTHAGDDRVFVVQRNGVIWQYRAGDAQPEVFLDIVDLVDDSGSGGLYTAAFHPDFAGNGRFFVSYTESGSAAVPLRTVIARYESAPGSPNPVDPATGRVVLRFDQPAPSHNNGQIAFSPKDGNLYIGSGDGGHHDGCEAQFGHHLLGKILRIDVDAGADQPPYHSIPADNPFLAAGDGVADETWALGFRNPWRFSFDRVSGDLFIADVGEFLKEEVNRQPADSPGGENYGWRVMEGSVCNSADPEAAGCPVGTPSCFDAAYSVPIFDYDTGENCAIVGGYVYRGDAIRAFAASTCLATCAARGSGHSPSGQMAVSRARRSATPTPSPRDDSL